MKGISTLSPKQTPNYMQRRAVTTQESYDNYMRRRYREEEEKITKWDRRFIDMAKLVSGWSKDPSSQIGAIIVNDERRILATGYNGFPRGIEDTEERLNNRYLKYPRIVHAEMNALMNALYNGVPVRDGTLYVYGLPICPFCAKSIIQAGIKRIVIPKPIENSGEWEKVWKEESLPMFKEAGVKCDLI